MVNSKIKIIVVEDEAMIAMDIQEKLIEMGYDVPLTVDNGIDAMKYAGLMSPDLFLMDIVIKGELDGIQTAERIKKIYGVPSLFLTAYDNSSVMERIKQVNPLGYLLKPFEDSKLQEIILQLQINDRLSG